MRIIWTPRLAAPLCASALLLATLLLAACGTDNAEQGTLANTTEAAPLGDTATASEAAGAAATPEVITLVPVTPEPTTPAVDPPSDESAPIGSAERSAAEQASVDETSADEASESGGESTTDAAAAPSVRQAATAAAEGLITSLDANQVQQLLYDFGDRAIATTWSNLPACQTNGRAGVRHGDLSDVQLDAAFAVVDAVLSDQGLVEYRQVIAADEELGGGNGDVWDADCYYLAIFGTPSMVDSWALQFGGHHYVRTVTFDAGGIAVTPAFTGVEPQSFVLDGEVVEVLADERDSIFAIFDGLTDGEAASAQLVGTYNAVLLGPGDDDAFPAQPEGLAIGQVSSETRAALLAAIRTWVDDFDAEMAGELMATIESELDETYIGWAGSADPEAQGAYARIDGPSVWIEFSNQAGVGGNSIHHHSVYRDKTTDYGSAA